jgi:hypothetical protein
MDFAYGVAFGFFLSCIGIGLYWMSRITERRQEGLYSEACQLIDGLSEEEFTKCQGIAFGRLEDQEYMVRNYAEVRRVDAELVVSERKGERAFQITVGTATLKPSIYLRF